MKRQVEKNLDYSSFIGVWINSHNETAGIERFEILEKSGDVFIHVFGAENGFYPGDWGQCKFHPYAYGIDLKEAMAFSATYKTENKEIILAVNFNKGLLIIAGFYQFRDESGRSDCLIREFFYKI